MKGAAFATAQPKNVGTSASSVATAQKALPALPEKGISRFLLIVGLILMFILAIFLGGVIAVLTIPGRAVPSKAGAMQSDAILSPLPSRTA